MSTESAGNASRRRVAIVAGVLLAWGVTAGLAWLDVESRGAEARARGEAELAGMADVVNALYVAEEGRIDGELARLRTELRAQGAWASPGAFETEGAARPGDRAGIDGQRIEAALRRALTRVDAFAGLELVVAGHDGLRLVGVERDEEGRPRRMDWAPDERDGIAKALWYAGEVARAVDSSGRRVERGEVGFEGVIERPVARAAVGLHDPGQLVQGVLVAAIDLTDLAGRLGAVVPPSLRVTLLSVDGRPLDPARRDEASLARLVDLTGRVFAEPDGTTVFEADDALVLGRPLTRAEGGVASTLALLEAEAPPSGARAWLATFWPFVVALFTLVAGFAVYGVLRGGAAVSTRAREPKESASSAGASRDAESPSLGLDLVEAPVELRGWLADIRGCLEREAATRGLAIDLRCEKSLPPEIESDAGWLGGLVVAMGREALDATARDRVLVEVLEDAGDTLRFEVDAGDVELRPVAGMNEVASGVGGHFEHGQGGRLALVVPSLLA